MKRITVIVPAYNEERHIERTLSSLKAQTYPSYEIIVVNNNSTDRTGELAKLHVKRVYLETQKGYHNAVSRGVREARTPYITICDADSIYPPDWLERIMAHFEAEPELLGVYGTTQFHDLDPARNWLSGLAFSGFLRFSLLLGFHNPAGFNFAMKRSAYLAVGGYDPAIFNGIYMDVELGKRIASRGPLRMDTRIRMMTSSRRFRGDGFVRTTWNFLEAWARLNFGRQQRISYEQYNTAHR